MSNLSTNDGVSWYSQRSLSTSFPPHRVASIAFKERTVRRLSGSLRHTNTQHFHIKPHVRRAHAGKHNVSAPRDSFSSYHSMAASMNSTRRTALSCGLMVWVVGRRLLSWLNREDTRFSSLVTEMPALSSTAFSPASRTASITLYMSIRCTERRESNLVSSYTVNKVIGHIYKALYHP